MAFPSGGFILKVVVAGGEFMVWKPAVRDDGVAPGSWFMWNGCWVSSDGRSMEALFLSLVRWGISFHDGMKEHHLVVGGWLPLDGVAGWAIATFLIVGVRQSMSTVSDALFSVLCC